MKHEFTQWGESKSNPRMFDKKYNSDGPTKVIVKNGVVLDQGAFDALGLTMELTSPERIERAKREIVPVL